MRKNQEEKKSIRSAKFLRSFAATVKTPHCNLLIAWLEGTDKKLSICSHLSETLFKWLLCGRFVQIHPSIGRYVGTLSSKMTLSPLISRTGLPKDSPKVDSAALLIINAI